MKEIYSKYNWSIIFVRVFSFKKENEEIPHKQ